MIQERLARETCNRESERERSHNVPAMQRKENKAAGAFQDSHQSTEACVLDRSEIEKETPGTGLTGFGLASP